MSLTDDDKTRIAQIQGRLAISVGTGPIEPQYFVRMKVLHDDVPWLIAKIEVLATKDNMSEALDLLEAYHYKTEYDLDTMRCKAYTCRLCGATLPTDDLPEGESLAYAVAAIPHRECVLLSIRALVGDPWTKD